MLRATLEETPSLRQVRIASASRISIAGSMDDTLSWRARRTSIARFASVVRKPLFTRPRNARSKLSGRSCRFWRRCYSMRRSTCSRPNVFSAWRRLCARQRTRRLSSSSFPPCARATMWSISRSVVALQRWPCSSSNVQRHPSRSKTARRSACAIRPAFARGARVDGPRFFRGAPSPASRGADRRRDRAPSRGRRRRSHGASSRPRVRASRGARRRSSARGRNGSRRAA